MEQPIEQPMITVKQAAELLDVDPRTIREKLATKQLRGEKRLYGLREKWYVNKSDVDALIQDQQDRAADLHETRVDTQDIENLFDSEEDDTIDIDEVEPVPRKEDFNANLEVLVRAITKQFSEELSNQKEIVVELKKDLEEKDRQLKLIPDLEKQAAEKHKAVELKEFEKQALEKQLNLVKKEREEKEKKLQAELKTVEEDKKTSEENEANLRTELEVLESVQKAYTELEDEHLAMREDLEKYKALANKSGWERFSDWLMGK